MKMSKVLAGAVSCILALGLMSCGEKPAVVERGNPTDTLTPALEDDVKEDSVLNRDFKEMTIVQDGTNLVVSFIFEFIPGLWENDSLSVFIAHDATASEDTSVEENYWESAASFMSYSKAYSFKGVATPKGGVLTKTYDGDTATGDNMTSSVTWTQNSDTWQYETPSATVTYTIPLANIGAESGDVLLIAGALGAYDWNTLESNGRYIVDAVPAGAFTLSTSESLAATNGIYTTAKDTAYLDFSKALEFTVE